MPTTALARPVAAEAAHRGRACPKCPTTSASGPCASGRASTLPTIRHSKADSASWWRRTTCTRSSGWPIRPTSARSQRAVTLELKISGLAARANAAVKAASRSTTTRPIEGLRALDRHTLRFTLEQPRPRFIEALALSDLLGGIAREVVERYGDTIGEHPVGTGPFRLKCMAAQLAHRAGAQPGLPRGAVRRRAGQPTTPRARRSWRASKGRRLPMVDEVDVAIDRGRPAALAEFPEQAGRRAGQHRGHAAQPVRQRGDARRQARAAARASMRMHGQLLAPDSAVTPTSTCIDPDGRRQRTGAGGAAPRDQPGLRRRSGDPPASGAASAVPAQSPLMPHTTRLRPGVQERDRATTTRARAGAARPVRLSSTATATACANARRLAARCCRWPPQPEQINRAVQRAVAKVHERGGPAHPLQHRAMAREPEGRRRRQADDVAARRDGHADPMGRIRWHRCTARWRATTTWRASSSTRFDRLYERAQVHARRPRARRAVPPSATSRGGLHAVQDPRAPHLTPT